MCGIAGFSISDKDHRKINCRLLACKLALQIQRRGTDATGIAWSATDEEHGLGVYYMKSAVPAHEFIDSMDQVARHTRTAIIHTRYATKGSPENNDNNHPILVGNTVGIHNGGIRNDDQIIEEVGTGRTAQVDTEAIFRLIDASENPVRELHRLQGTAAIAWLNTDSPNEMHLARVIGSPLWVGTTEGGSLIFASIENMLRTAAMQAGVKLTQVKEIGEGMYFKVINGKVVDFDLIKEGLSVA